MSRLVGELVKSGQLLILMIMTLLMWESTTIAGILMGNLVESGAIPLIQMSGGSTALFHIVIQHTDVRKAIHWVSVMPES